MGNASTANVRIAVVTDDTPPADSDTIDISLSGMTLYHNETAPYPYPIPSVNDSATTIAGNTYARANLPADLLTQISGNNDVTFMIDWYPYFGSGDLRASGGAQIGILCTHTSYAGQMFISGAYAIYDEQIYTRDGTSSIKTQFPYYEGDKITYATRNDSSVTKFKPAGKVNDGTWQYYSAWATFDGAWQTGPYIATALTGTKLSYSIKNLRIWFRTILDAELESDF